MFVWFYCFSNRKKVLLRKREGDREKRNGKQLEKQLLLKTSFTTAAAALSATNG